MPIPGFLVASALGGAAPAIIRRLGGGLARRPVATALGAAGLGAGLGLGIPRIPGIGGNEEQPRRRRRRSLTSGQMRDIVFLSQNVSKRAAENYILGATRL